VTIRLMDGDYPPYQKVIPASSEKVLKVNRSRLIQALRRVATLASDRNKGMVFTIMPNQLELSISQTDFGAARDEVPVEYDGERFEVFVNVYYMLEALNVLDTEEVTMEFNPGNAPIVMRPEPPKDFFNLVMPMRK
jgi:DNA polymerase-3 subunit beta